MIATMLGIVIPTLNAEATLAQTLDSVSHDHAPISDRVVVDGGSTDGTRQIATEHGVRVVISTPGRGRQLAAGADSAMEKNASWLLFLHADTRLADDWGTKISHFITNEQNHWRAAYFQLSFDDDSPEALRVARLANWRANTFALPYGDQGLLISSDLYEMVGGYNRELDLMEDVDFVRRLNKTPGAELIPFNSKLITSSARYQKDGWWARPLRNLLCLALFLLGASQDRLKRLYQ